MTLPIPALDDLTWADLVSEARDLLPAAAPGWTDHNVHDPGITIIELLAWLAESTCYRLDQIPLAHRARFLSLLGDEAGLVDPTSQRAVSAALAAAGRRLQAHETLVELAAARDVDSLDDIERDLVDATAVPARAATTLDIERIALATPDHHIARARAFAGLDAAVPCARAPGTVSLVIVTPSPTARPDASADVIRDVRRWTAARKLVGTRLRVSAPRYTAVSIGLNLRLEERVDHRRVVRAVERAVRRFLHPLHGGQHGRGWPFGRDVYRSEIMTVAGEVGGVDVATDVRLSYSDNGVNGGAPSGCANLCIPALDLVDLTDVAIEVDR